MQYLEENWMILDPLENIFEIYATQLWWSF